MKRLFKKITDFFTTDEFKRVIPIKENPRRYPGHVNIGDRIRFYPMVTSPDEVRSGTCLSNDPDSKTMLIEWQCVHVKQEFFHYQSWAFANFHVLNPHIKIPPKKNNEDHIYLTDGRRAPQL